jgi:hypothetical protein
VLATIPGQLQKNWEGKMDYLYSVCENVARVKGLSVRRHTGAERKN